MVLKIKYEEPLIEMVRFETGDIISTSGGPGFGEGEEELE